MRILLVDDEVGLTRVVQRGLEAEGHVVDVQHNGADGLWAATETAYDVVLLDILMPGLSGYEVLRRLRTQENWTPVLMLTAKDGEYDQADALDLGADDYLTKPFSFVVLSARLRSLARRGAVPRPAVLTGRRVSLDPAARLVTRDGETVRLTAREFGLLHYLMRHPGAVLTKADILDNVWDANYSGDDNVVEVYIFYLRKKLGTEFFETVRGAGYRFTP